MITEFKQTVSYARIQLVKNYCVIENKKKWWDNTIKDPIDDLFVHNEHKDRSVKVGGNEIGIIDSEQTKTYKGFIFALPDVKKKHKCFFTKNDNGISERFDLPFVKRTTSNEFYTEKSRQIRRHFANPFSSITLFHYEKSITKSDDKIRLKIFKQHRKRGFNSRYFKTKKETKTLSLNLKTGDITVGFKNYRKNNFNMISIFLREFFEVSVEVVGNDMFKLEMLNKMIPVELLRNLCQMMGDDGDKIRHTIDGNTLYGIAFNRIVDFFVDKKRLKVPDVGVVKYLRDYYPTEKYFKVNDRKLVSSVVDMLGLKSKVLIKILHQHPDVNHRSLFLLCKILGDNYSKYIGNIKDDSFFPKTKLVGIDNTHDEKSSIINFESKYVLTEIEKQNVISVVNDMKGEFLKDHNLTVFMDQLRMIERIKKYDPNLHFKSRTEEQYMSAHVELSKMISTIRKGWVVEYTFAQQMVDDVERPLTITVDDTSVDPNLTQVTPQSVSVTFYPYILKREEDYIEEGSVMHHCVATYSNKDKSIIISVRTKDHSDRVTCEYNCQDGRLLQARHFCNGVPPADMEYAIEDLTKKVVKYAKLGMLHAINKEKVPVKINGIDVKIEEPRSPLEVYVDDMWAF